MKERARLYHFLYHFELVKIIRFVWIVYLAGLLIAESSYGVFPKLTFSTLSFFAMLEVFFAFSFVRIKPKTLVTENDGKDIFESFTLDALDVFLPYTKTQQIVKKLLHKKSVEFILTKAVIEKKELSFFDISKNELAQRAFQIANERNGLYVTTVDLFAAYLFLTEKDSKLLFNKTLKDEEFMNIVHWAAKEHHAEEHIAPVRVQVWGEGFGEWFTVGWTPETQKYSFDYTERAIQKRPVLTGREQEFGMLIEALSKSENNNVLLVGESGVGKDALIEALAYQSFNGDLKGVLHRRRVFELLVSAFMAGATTRGDLEGRLQTIIAEISHSGNIILYIPQFQNIVGSSEFNLNISGALLPYLRNGTFPIIATMNPAAYRQWMESNPLKEAFTVIKIEEPSRENALRMIFDAAEEIERKARVILSYQAIASSVEYAHRYIQDMMLPGSAVKLLDDTAAYVQRTEATFFGKTGRKMVLADAVTKKIEEQTHIAVAAPKEHEKEVLMNMEEEIHKRIIDQQEAVTVIAESLRRIRTGLSSREKPISFLFLGPTGVGKTETAKALASIYFGGEDKMIRLDMSEYTTSDGVKRLLGAPPGEGEEKGELTQRIYEKPFSLVLLDEFEKAHPTILDLFLQVFEDGRLTDNKGKTVSFINSIIIATSNAASEFIRQEVVSKSSIDTSFQTKLLNVLQEKGIFKPELLNRFDDVVVFKPLGESEMLQITDIMLKKVAKKLAEQDITVEFDATVTAKVVREGFDQQFGARPLRRYIQDNIEDILAQKILSNEIKRGSRVILSTNSDQALTFLVQ